MSDWQAIEQAIKRLESVNSVKALFETLGYPAIHPLEEDVSQLPQGALNPVASVHRIVNLGNGSPLRIYHVELEHETIRRSDIRRFLEAFYRHYPQGENLFVFTPPSYEDIAFVSPRRLPDPRDQSRVRLWLRILPVQRQRPYRTDLEVLSRIRADGIRDPQELWQRHDEAFSVQRVTEQFFRDYAEVFDRIRTCLARTHPDNGPEWARDYAHQLLNRIMFLYFIARKGWLLGPGGEPDRDFMRHFWEAYRDSKRKNSFHWEWLHVLFFDAFNNRWQGRHEYLKRFPSWVVSALAQAPFLNGGLYTRRLDLDDRLQEPLPDEIFILLFEKWLDGTFPGLFERYNFTVVETGRFDEEVAVDPEMLGVVYERLVNITFEAGEEDLRGAAGIFYTPRTEIDLMCRLALVDWLTNHLGQKHKNLLYELVFAFGEEEKRNADVAVTQSGLWEWLDHLIKNVRVCDPACGSGAFLVGMLLVLDDLQNRCNAALGIGETAYERRKRILRDQLYGVDVMEWAVRVAELRLWLQLVVETELHPAELHFKPLLPNLNFKLRPGDSLLQAVGDIDLSPFRRSELPIPAHLKGKLTQLKGKKRRFFLGEDGPASEVAIKKEEMSLFREILEAKIFELGNLIKQKNRELLKTPIPKLPGMELAKQDRKARARLEEEIEELEKQLRQLKEALKALKPDQPPPFAWDLAFAEIFEVENPGFDIVIGNPPYVRQEKIRDYLGRFERKKYLARLNSSLQAIYPGFMGKSRRISGRADYYIYFYLHALSLLADKGTFCFITSNSWLDVDFGKDLQEFFLRHGHLKMVIDNRAKRSFAQADVNTIIVLAAPPERKRELVEEETRGRSVRFVAFRVPFEEALNPVVFLEIEDESLYHPLAGFRVLTRPEFRSVLWDQWSLYLEGLEAREWRLEEACKYLGNKWGGKYLRAPDIFFTILERGKGKLVRLGDVAEVRRGFTTGANAFFYLEPVDLMVEEVAKLREKDSKAPVLVKNGAGWEGEIEAAWLRPVIKSPREIRILRVRLEDLRYLVFMPPEDVRQAIERGNRQPWRGYPLAAKYIRWGEQQGYPDRPTCASRRWWWDLREPRNGPIAWAMIHAERHSVHHNPQGVELDHNFFEISPIDGGTTTLAATSISAVAILIKELFGRQYGGGSGPIKNEGIDIAGFMSVDLSALFPTSKQRLFTAFNRLANQPVRSIFEELGFELCRSRRCSHPEHPYEYVWPDKLTLEQVRQASPDRFELDSVVFDALGLADEERLEVYKAVVQLVKDRLVKARSV